MKPLLKWAGGKRAIAGELFSNFPADWDTGTYIEPFIGGGAMFLHINPKKAVIADLNKRLINFYTYVKNEPEPIYAKIMDIAKRFNRNSTEILKKEYFLEIRKAFNSSESTSLESAAYLYALNKLCFNGLYRENSRGEFNVPFGQKKIFPALELAEVKNVSLLLRNTKIINSDFETTTKIAKAGDFIYFDPPYIPVNTSSSFTSYHAVGFDIEDQKRLAELMVDLAKNGIRAMCSNSDTPVSRDIYKELDIRAIRAPRMVSAKASGRGSISELLVTNY